MQLCAEAAQEKQRGEMERSAWLAWHTAMFHRAKQLPDYGEIQRRLGLAKEPPVHDRLMEAFMAFSPPPSPPPTANAAE